ncbi:sensor histidine kinase [Micromonospora marina]|uniref:sensor histidine kinase n=1 Tax=Micromonospora marina TaxID=307120 RepID=UPI0034557B88
MVTRSPVLSRLGQLAALFLMACLGLIDVFLGLPGDGGVVGLQVLVAVTAVAVWLSPHRQGSTVLPKVAFAVGVASLALTPLVVVDASDWVDGSYGLAESLGLLGVVFVVCRRADVRWAVVAVPVVVMAIGVLPLRGDLGYGGAVYGLAQVLVAMTVIGAGAYLRTIENNRLHGLATARAEQRAEFARDLHDFIAHHVTGIVVQAQGARFVAEQDPTRAVQALEHIEAAGVETMAAMRRMVGVLRREDGSAAVPLAPLAGMEQIAPLVERFGRAGGPLTRLHVDGSTSNIPVEVGTTAYRVVMEALTNVQRHAHRPRFVDVWVRRAGGWLLVRVTNDGPAPRHRATAAGTTGYGLLGLQERVTAVRGRLTAGPGIDGGWVVDAALPLRREATE